MKRRGLSGKINLNIKDEGSVKLILLPSGGVVDYVNKT